MSSSTQIPIELTFYDNGTSANVFGVSKVLTDSSMNQYFIFGFIGNDHNTHIAKRNLDGTQLWVKEYSGFYLKSLYDDAQMSLNESTIRILGESVDNKLQIMEVLTSDGAMTSAYQTAGILEYPTEVFQVNID